MRPIRQYYSTNMYMQSTRKKQLTTYSKKPSQTLARASLLSSSPYHRERQKRRITLTSPVRGANLPTSLASISLSSPVESDDDCDKPHQDSPNPNLVPSSRHGSSPSPYATSAALSNLSASPASSSEPDPISETESMLDTAPEAKRARARGKPRLLTALRRSLNVRPRALKMIQRKDRSRMSAGRLGEIERGADGFDQVHLALLPRTRLRDRRRIKLQGRSIQQSLELYRGPHAPVDFDESSWMINSHHYNNESDQMQTPEVAEPAGGSVQVPETARESKIGINDERLGNPIKPPKRPSTKDVSVYAQLSSISAPIKRRGSYAGESEHDYDDSEEE